MITSGNLGALMGAPVLGPEDEKIGTVGQLFVDPASGNPNWITVRMGLFGKESFVPLHTAEWDQERIRVTFGKDRIRAAPRIDAQDTLSHEEERELYEYYGLPHDVASSGDASVPESDGGQPPRRGAHAADVEPDLPPSTGSISTVGAHVLRENEGQPARLRMRRYEPPREGETAAGDGSPEERNV